jgi:imidazole glycerol phosphate synthase subunit HisF
MRTGPNLEATARLARTIAPCTVIASGGASAVLAASIFHFGEHVVGQARAYPRERGVPVRV